ncbi:MAG: hypothetical protein J4G16_04920 [Acidobacteria bacterium]|nr:hypothetical protein [Acidobacteriota bacterium]
MQKARYSNDVMRFRRYLGMHYADERNTVTYAEGGCERKRPRRLTTIAEQQEAIAARDATIESQRAEIEAPKSATSSCAEIAR